MIYIDTHVLLVLLGYSIFMPFFCLFVGWFARGGDNERV